MRCNDTDGMPRGDFYIYFASNRRGYVRAEEWVPLIYVNVCDLGIDKPTEPVICLAGPWVSFSWWSSWQLSLFLAAGILRRGVATN